MLLFFYFFIFFTGLMRLKPSHRRGEDTYKYKYACYIHQGLSYQTALMVSFKALYSPQYMCTNNRLFYEREKTYKVRLSSRLSVHPTFVNSKLAMVPAAEGAPSVGGSSKVIRYVKLSAPEARFYHRHINQTSQSLSQDPIAINKQTYSSWETDWS